MKNKIIQLAHQFEQENNAAYDLWTWLPSYKDAKQKYGDYADKYTPCIADIMREAALFISCDLNPSKEQK